MSGTVTGTLYTSTRPRGLASWSPQKATLLILAAILEVLEEYRAQLPMTARQIFYRLVGRGLLGKDENSYARLCEHLNRARRAGMIPWDAIRDDGGSSTVPGGYVDVDEVEATIEYTINSFKLAFEPCVEVWVEAAGMLPMIARSVAEYRVPVYSSGGFDSVTAKHTAATRMKRRHAPTTVLHVGDLDPSGNAIVDSAAEDVAAFLADYGKPGFVRFERIAVTPAQAAEHELPTAPPKKTDRRGGAMTETVQAEAFAPDVLVDIVRQAVNNTVDLDALAEHEATEVEARAELLARMGGES